MAIRRTLAQFSDEIVAADIAANAVGASELADNAVDTAAIATNAVTATEIVAGAVTEAKLNADVTDGSAIATGVKPHIIPDVLYPAVANIMVDGTTALSAVTTGPNSSTVASSKYGTVQSDGRMYYYTDIKGSKPIKDPRIGAHFGSQRHKFKSLQLLEQETATHGDEVYSIDGREWARFVRVDSSNPPAKNEGDGVYFQMQSSSSKTAILEVTGYFNELNIVGWTSGTGAGGNVDSSNPLDYHLNGGGDLGNLIFKLTPSGNDPKSSRYVDAGSVINVPSLSATLGINTVKFVVPTSKYCSVYGIELIAQDTTSTATKSQIQIPSQNVVSYGKKFTVSETKHYNPFAFKTDGSTAWASGAHNGTAWPIGTGSSTNIDTATSLGLAAWVSTNYYKPYNGGRVVKWVASDGTIKTSVNMMPPNARSILTTAISAKANAAVANNTYLPTFEAGTVDHSLAEVAKTFHWREFGNGSANAGTHATTPVAPYADASMLNTGDDIAYVMDDGLTSFSSKFGNIHAASGDFLPSGTNDYWYYTFIGTGVTLKTTNYAAGTYNIVQNLSYGTHILKGLRPADGTPDYTIDGVVISPTGTTYGSISEVSFHQPKMPPIPEDAVVIADYMLMADFVRQADPTSATDVDKISKGVRIVSPTRDVFANNIDAFYGSLGGVQPDPSGVGPMGYYLGSSATASANASDSEWQLPAFGTTFVAQGHSGTSKNDVHIDGVDVAHSGTSNTDHSAIVYPDSAVALGQHDFAVHGVNSVGYSPYLSGKGFQIASPIHTSSHYQTFETPFLHELVGGDRNMEQTNLVVTPDGKTWDEVTRDVSYIGKKVLHSGYYGGNGSVNPLSFDEWRGENDKKNRFNKDWAIAYDRVICLVGGQYRISFHTYSHTTGMYFYANKNAVSTSGNNYDMMMYGLASPQDMTLVSDVVEPFKRGDWVQFGSYNGNMDGAGRTWIAIERV